MSQSPYDRTAALIGERYRRNPIAFCALVLVAAWALWTIYEMLTAPAGVGWWLLARDAVEAIGSGLIVAVGVLWLLDVVRGG
jgi:hypothetical protein